MAGVNKSINVTVKSSKAADAATPWVPLWPNPADVPYNYYNLLNLTATSGIANVANTSAAQRRIAIVGTGYGGLTTARELFRAGYQNITLFEADDRLSGRGYPVMPTNVAGQPVGITPFELGAMRIPFFDPADGSGVGNSCTRFYADQYQVQHQDFPDPAAAPGNTGIYMNNGFGPAPDPDNYIGMLIWKYGTTEPPTADLQAVYNAWANWSYNVIQWCAPQYANSNWIGYWQKIVQVYEYQNFRDVALAPPKIYYNQDGSVNSAVLADNQQGDFGGLGLTQDQADLFYTIGAGDGSWGAFFDIAALYPIRTLLFGYGTAHQLMGYVFQDAFNQLPMPSTASAGFFFDSLNNAVQLPYFAGLSAIPAMHFFQPVSSNNSSNGLSLWQAMQPFTGSAQGVQLMTSSQVVEVDWQNNVYIVTTSGGQVIEFDDIVFTPPGWSLQMNINLTQAFMKQVFITPSPTDQGDNFWPPLTAWKGIKMSHNITSAKIFFKLTKQYWSAVTEGAIPQVIVTDTFLQDAYGYVLNTDASGLPIQDAGVLLASYTWEDDSNKFAADHSTISDTDLAVESLAKLDEILAQCGYPLMSNYVDMTVPPVVWHWEQQPLYRSCAKLYRAGSFDWNYAQLTWNQNHSASKSVYFAGEFASLEGGWIEPAMRGALDTVVNLVKNTVDPSQWASVFNNYSMIQNYPVIADWRPTPNVSI